MGSSFAACWHTWRRVLLAQEIPGAGQEHPGMARKSSWLDLGIMYPGKPTGSLHEPGSWGGGVQPGAAQEAPGAAHGWIWASQPTWLRAARSNRGSSRSSLRVPRSGQEELLAGFGHPWLTWLRAGGLRARVHGGGLYLYNTLTCVGRKGDA